MKGMIRLRNLYLILVIFLIILSAFAVFGTQTQNITLKVYAINSSLVFDEFANFSTFSLNESQLIVYNISTSEVFFEELIFTEENLTCYTSNLSLCFSKENIQLTQTEEKKKDGGSSDVTITCNWETENYLNGKCIKKFQEGKEKESIEITNIPKNENTKNSASGSGFKLVENNEIGLNHSENKIGEYYGAEKKTNLSNNTINKINETYSQEDKSNTCEIFIIWFCLKTWLFIIAIKLIFAFMVWKRDWIQRP